MNRSEYARYYFDLLQGVLGGNRAPFEIMGRPEEFDKYTNYRRGLLILALVSLTEANLLAPGDLKALRKFHRVGLPPEVNQTHLSCFIYLRDCVAHDPATKLFPATQENTKAFVNAVESGTFPYAAITGDRITIIDTHQLHVLVLQLYEARGDHG